MTLSHHILLAVIAGLSLTAGGSLQDTAVAPDTVVIFTDDLGYQDLGCFGFPLILTPS